MATDIRNSFNQAAYGYKFSTVIFLDYLWSIFLIHNLANMNIF